MQPSTDIVARAVHDVSVRACVRMQVEHSDKDEQSQTGGEIQVGVWINPSADRYP